MAITFIDPPEHPEFEAAIVSNRGKLPIDPLEQTEETSPIGQRIVENLGQVAGGYGTTALAGLGLQKALGSNFGKALLNSPKSLGKQYAAQDAALKISRDIPETAPRVTFENPYGATLTRKPPRAIPVKTAYESNLVGAEPLPTSVPTKLPENFAGFKKFAESRIKNFGQNLRPQEVMNYKVYLKNVLDQTPKFDANGKVTTLYAEASKLNNEISGLFQKVADKGLTGASLPEGVMSSRSGLDRINSLSNTIRSVPKRTAKTALKIGAGAGGAGLAYRLYQALGRQ